MSTDILSNKILLELKEDVDSLKRKLAKPELKSEELVLEIESLKESLHELTNIFQKTLELTKEDDLTRVIKERLDAVIRQNETIARGMVAISDKVDDFIGGKITAGTAPVRRMMPMKHALGAPYIPGRVAPVPTAHSGMDELDLPPPPPVSESKRQGLFR